MIIHWDEHITPNFLFGEFFVRVQGGQRVPDEKSRVYFVGLPSTKQREIIANIAALANRLQFMRDMLGEPIFINSGFRCPEVNAEVGGKPSSRHLTGMAADIQIDSQDQDFFGLSSIWSGGHGKAQEWCHLDVDDTKINGKYRRWTY